MTGVIDEPRDVAPYACVDHGAVGQLEAPDVPAFDVAALALQTLLARDFFSCVVDDARILGDRPGREHAPLVDLRLPPFDHLRLRIQWRSLSRSHSCACL